MACSDAVLKLMLNPEGMLCKKEACVIPELHISGVCPWLWKSELQISPQTTLVSNEHQVVLEHHPEGCLIPGPTCCCVPLLRCNHSNPCAKRHSPEEQQSVQCEKLHAHTECCTCSCGLMTMLVGLVTPQHLRAASCTSGSLHCLALLTSHLLFISALALPR